MDMVVDRVVKFIVGILFILITNGCSYMTLTDGTSNRNYMNYSVINQAQNTNSTMVITQKNPNKVVIYNYNDPNRFPSHRCHATSGCNHNNN
jgi:hypothetical protein